MVPREHKDRSEKERKTCKILRIKEKKAYECKLVFNTLIRTVGSGH